MRIGRALLIGLIVTLVSTVAGVTEARAQPSSGESRIVIDVGVGLDSSINGNVNSGAIGVLQGQATAFLPQPYADVYGTGVQLRFGGGYVLDDVSELRAMFTFQSADADLVRLGDIGPSSLYAQYSDYKSLSLDLGYRRYVPIPTRNLRVYAEGTLGAAFIDNINVTLAAPQSNIVFTSTDFYDQTAAFVWTVGGGVLFRIGEQVDLNAQVGLRHVSGLADVDQFVGTGLDSVNNDSGRLTLPVIVGARFRFK
jgi:hypothetical protein